MPSRNATTAALIVVAIVFCVTVLAVLAAFLFAPEGRDLTLVIGPLLGTLAPTIAAVALLMNLNKVDAKVEEVRQDTYRLTNGLLDAKVRAGVADVVKDEHLDPGAVALIAQDRKVRDMQHSGEPSEADPHRPE